jgi:hypothetical protein
MTSISPRQAETASDRGTVHPTSVYRYYDRRGALIYVGITRQAIGRNRQHNEAAEWWRFVARQEVEHHPSRAEAAAREVELIRQYRPPFNKQHNIGWQDLRALYVAYAQQADGEPLSLIEEYRLSGRNLALHVVEHDPCGDRLVLRTGVEYPALASRLTLEDRVDVMTHGPAGRVIDVGWQGPFAVIHCKVRERRPIESAAAKIKHRYKRGPEQPECVLLQRVILTPDRADA